MKTVAELRAELAQVLGEADKIMDAIDEDGRQMNAEEEAKYNAAIARAEILNTEIERRDKYEGVKAAQLGKMGSRAAANPLVTEPDDTEISAMPKATINHNGHIEIPRSYGKLRAFAHTPEGQFQAYRAGQWIRAMIYGDAKSADWCRQNGVGVRAALAGGVNTTGGALVPTEMERAIIDLREAYGLFRRVCRISPMGSDTRNIPRRTGGLTAYFVGENTAGTESTAAWDNVMLTAKKLMVLTRMSSEVAEDAVIDLADTMAEEVAYAFAYKEDVCGLTGDGTSTYGGITGVLVKAIDGSHDKAKVAAASGHDTLPEVDANDLINLMSVIPIYAKAGSAWFCSPTAQEVVFNAIKIAGGGTTRDMLAQADTPMFLGYPIYTTDIMADSVSTTYNGTVMLAFGNLRLACTMGDRRGIRVALSNEQYWEEDQIGIKGTERFDIVAHDLGSNTAKSPFAVLVGTT